jgi:hypothetical protein
VTRHALHRLQSVVSAPAKRKRPGAIQGSRVPKVARVASVPANTALAVADRRGTAHVAAAAAVTASSSGAPAPAPAAAPAAAASSSGAAARVEL